jgi:RNA polymerase sigma-70 factor (ECF subfamily)
MPAPAATKRVSEAEAKLIDRARQGDALAFRAIMERHNQRLYRVARALLRDESEAEDAVQESYLRAFSGLSGFSSEASISTWLTSIVINECLGRKRKQRPSVPLDTVQSLEVSGAQIIRFPGMNANSDPERSAARIEIRKLLESSIDALPEAFRIVFVMRDVEELSIEETAAVLGIRPPTVKTRLHRARLMLRAALQDQLASSLKDTFPFAGARCARITEAVLARLPVSPT